MAGDRYRLKTLTIDGTKRYPMLLGRQSMPDWHATLFVTMQLRDARKIANTMISVLMAIRTLLIWTI